MRDAWKKMKVCSVDAALVTKATGPFATKSIHVKTTAPICVASFRIVFTPALVGYEVTTFIQKMRHRAPAVSSVAKRTLSVREVWGSVPGLVKSTQCRLRLATAATPTTRHGCVVQALNRGDGPRNLLHPLA